MHDARSTLRRSSSTGQLSAGFIVIMALLFSLLFIFSICLAFVNSTDLATLGEGLENGVTGIVLVGENVDVDVDEPALTIRWTIGACGADFVLPDAPRLHGVSGCGIPAMPLDIYSENSKEPIITYDPTNIPTDASSGRHSFMQSLVQFDSDHVLDVHDARLYPFDTYLLTTSFRATISGHDTRVPISRLIVIKVTPSFIVSSVDTAIAMFVDGVEEQARFLELRVRRPADARFYTMILFGINWILSHFNFGFVVLRAFHSDENHKNVSGVSNSSATDKYNGTKEAVKQLAGVLAALLVIPQLRDAMPDAPGFDGMLIDIIGFFPQMVISGISAIALMLILLELELRHSEDPIPLDAVDEPARHKHNQPFRSAWRLRTLHLRSNSVFQR